MNKKHITLQKYFKFLLHLAGFVTINQAYDFLMVYIIIMIK